MYSLRRWVRFRLLTILALNSQKATVLFTGSDRLTLDVDIAVSILLKPSDADD
jgi:hypothetical protein